MKRTTLLLSLLLAASAGGGDKTQLSGEGKGGTMTEKAIKSDAEWQKVLTPEQYRVLRQKGTERAFTGAYWNCHEKGVYKCAACGTALFASETKFDSGSGWPSFYAPLSKEAVRTEKDHSHGMDRVEVLCARCDGHLGHVFEDGPAPTGLRYCINSAAIKLQQKEPGKPAR